MAWFRCTGGNGGGGQVYITTQQLVNTRDTSQASESAMFHKDSIYGTDEKVETFTITADRDCSVAFGAGSKARTNTGDNDGFILIEAAGQEVFKKYLTTNNLTDLTGLGTYDLQNGQTLKIYVGFDNAHTNCWFDIYTAVCVLNQSYEIKEVLTMTETEYNALQQKDNDTVYYTTNSNGILGIAQYQGNRQIRQKADTSAYEFWYENLTFSQATSAASQSLDPTIYTGVQILSSANIGRDFQIEFNIETTSGGGGSENCIIGSIGQGSARFEIYTPKSTTASLYLYGLFGNDSNLGDVTDKDVVIKKEGNTLTTTIDGVQADSRTISWSSTDDTDYQLCIGSYRKYHTFCGKINYIGFKWLN